MLEHSLCNELVNLIIVNDQHSLLFLSQAFGLVAVKRVPGAALKRGDHVGCKPEAAASAHLAVHADNTTHERSQLF